MASNPLSGLFSLEAAGKSAPPASSPSAAPASAAAAAPPSAVSNGAYSKGGVAYAPGGKVSPPLSNIPFALSSPGTPSSVKEYLKGYADTVKSKLPTTLPAAGVSGGMPSVSQIINEVNKTIGEAPTPPSMAADYASLADKYNVTNLNSQILDLQNKKNAILTSLKQAETTTEFTPGITADVVSGRQSEQVRQANIQLESIDNQISTLTTQLGNANSTISMIMGFEQTDYTNARDKYNTSFSQALQMTQMVLGQANENKKIAVANFSTVAGLVTSGSIDPTNLSPEQSVQLDNMAVSAGFPAGTIQNLGLSAAAEQQTYFGQTLKLMQEPPKQIMTDPGWKFLGMGPSAKYSYQVYNPNTGGYQNFATLEEANTAQLQYKQQFSADYYGTGSTTVSTQDQSIYNSAIVGQ